MKRYVLCLITFFCCLSSFAQTNQIAEELLEIANENYSKGNYTKAIPLFHQAAQSFRKGGKTILLGKAFNNLANSYSQIGNSEAALQHYRLSLSISETLRDTLNIAKTFKNIGALYSEQKDFKMALQYYQRSYALLEQMGDTGLLADCLNNIGVVYEQQENYDKALEVYSAALEIYKVKKDFPRISMMHNNLGIVYKYLKDYQKSIKNYQQALIISEKTGDQFMVAANLNNLGNVYALIGDYQKSLELCQRAEKNARTIKAQEVIIESCDGIATAYEKLQNYPAALKYRKLYEHEKDSFISSNRSGQLADMEVKYQTRQKEDEIKLLNQESEIRNFKIEEQRSEIKIRNIFLLLFLVMLVGFTFTAYVWKGRQRFKNQLMIDKVIRNTEEIERVRIAKDIHDDLGSGLSKINFLSEIILQKTAHLPEVIVSSESIKDTARKMIENMRDLIWALNPDNTTLANLLARMREFTTDYLEDYPIEVEHLFQQDVAQTPITKEGHRNLFMVVKEVLHNIVKHSDATLVKFSAAITHGKIEIVIKDNGKGFKLESRTTGNGLSNMKSRLAAIGGVINIETNDSGTVIHINVPLSEIVKG